MTSNNDEYYYGPNGVACCMLASAFLWCAFIVALVKWWLR